MRSHALDSVTQNSCLRDVPPCHLAFIYWRFGGNICLLSPHWMQRQCVARKQRRKHFAWRHISKAVFLTENILNREIKIGSMNVKWNYFKLFVYFVPSPSPQKKVRIIYFRSKNIDHWIHSYYSALLTH